MKPLPSTNSKVDFVLITALAEERDAVLAKLPGYQKLPPTNDDIRTYFQADIPITFPDGSTGKYRVVVMCLSGMGRVQSATATADAIRQWHPRYIMLIGIAGGIAARNVQIGDILISDQIVDYELQKLTSDGPEVRWDVQRADPRLLNACNNCQDESWQELIKIERPRLGKPNRHTGPIASGDKVIAFSKILTRYQDMWLKLLGVEMEAAGVATAAFQSSDRLGFFMVRGVSDLADEKKGSSHVEKWRLYACDVAASFAIALLRGGPVPLLEETVQIKTKQVQLIFEGEFSEFTLIRQQEIVSVLALLLRIEQSDIRVLKVQQGSIVVIMEMLDKAANDLYELAATRNSRIMTLGIKSVLVEGRKLVKFADKSVEIPNNRHEQLPFESIRRNMTQNALIIEDDEEWRNVVREPLESLGLNVTVTNNRTEARQLLDRERYDIVIIDIMMDEKDLEIAKPKTAVLITYIRQHYPNTKCAILTGYGTLDFAIGAFRQLGIVDFYEKGSFNVIDFMKSIKELLALDASGAVTSPTKNLPPNTNTFLNIELERRKRELITQANNCRKESDEILLTRRNKRIAAKGNRADIDDDEWIGKRRKLLDERYQIALARIGNTDSLDEMGSVQLWLEKECNDWLGLSAG